MATLLNARNILLYSAESRVTGAAVSVSSGAATVIAVPKGATSPVPSAVTLTATITGYTVPAYSWSYRFGDSGDFITLEGTTNPLTVPWDEAFLTAADTATLVQYKVTVVETQSNLGINQSTYTLSIPILREGENGFNNVVVRIYKRTTLNAAPAIATDGNTTYNFSLATAVGIPSGWSTSIPDASEGGYLWFSEVPAVSQTSQYTFANTLWPTASLYSQDGTQGTNGLNTARVYAYKRSATAPTDNPGAVDYSFSTNAITTATLANSWQKTIPSGNDPLYVNIATASSITSTDTISAGEWSGAVLLSKNGVDGINSATVFLYARNNSISSAPSVPTTGTATYTFATGVLSGTIPSGWTQAIPAVSNGSVIWVIQATAAASDTTDTIDNNGGWSTPQVLAQKGDTGSNGTRGSRQLYSNNSSYSSSYTYSGNAAGAASYAVKATDLIAAAVAGTIPTTPIEGDTVTFTNGTTYVYTITYNSSTSTWQTPGTVIDGSLLVTGSVTAAKINASGLTIRDSSGNIILDAGNKTIDTALSIKPATVAGIVAGDLVWDASGTRTSGKGVGLTPGGLLGHNGTKTTFTIDATTGDATFAGTLNVASAASGARMEITNSVIRVYDTGGVLRVKLGDLS